MEENYKYHHFVCTCTDLSHNVVISEYLDDEFAKFDELTLSIHMNHYLPWYKRIWYALKYIFRSDCGTYDSIVINKENRDQIVKILTDFDYDRKI